MPTKPKITGGLLLLLVLAPLLGWWVYQDLGPLDENEGRQVPKIHQTDSVLEERFRAILEEALDGHQEWISKPRNGVSRGFATSSVATAKGCLASPMM